MTWNRINEKNGSLTRKQIDKIKEEIQYYKEKLTRIKVELEMTYGDYEFDAVTTLDIVSSDLGKNIHEIETLFMEETIKDE